MRNMSFALTTQQIQSRSKTVTRRIGWTFVKVGDVIMACEKCQGLKPGEKLVRLGPIRVTSRNREELQIITPNEVAKESFPDLSAAEFVAMFCKHMKCDPGQLVTRIEFEYLD